MAVFHPIHPKTGVCVAVVCFQTPKENPKFRNGAKTAFLATKNQDLNSPWRWCFWFPALPWICSSNKFMSSHMGESFWAVSSYPFYPFQVWSMKCVSKKSTSSTWESWLFNKLFSAFSKSLWPQRTVWDGGKSTASSKPCDVQTSIDCNFQEKWFGRIFGGDWIKVVSFPFQPFQPTLSSQRPHNFTLLLEAERGNCREVWFHLWWHLLGSVHWNGRSLLQRFYRSTWLGFCQWADCRIGIGKKRMFFCLKRANFPSSLFFVLVSCLNSWKFQLTWLDFFECKDTLKKTSQSKGPPSTQDQESPQAFLWDS